MLTEALLQIPNPLFDLAGILCGQFLIPFYTFFGATVLGKAVIKTSLQSLFIIALFSKDTTDFVLAFLSKHAPSLHPFAERLFHEQSQKFKTRTGSDADVGIGDCHRFLPLTPFDPPGSGAHRGFDMARCRDVDAGIFPCVNYRITRHIRDARGASGRCAKIVRPTT